MEKIANKIFSLLGLEVYRKTKKNGIQFPENHPANYVELIGVSGVGKSFIYHQLTKHQRNWWTTAEFIKQLEKVDADQILEQHAFYQDLAALRLQTIQNLNILPSSKFRIAHWNYRSLQDDAVIFQHNKNALIVSDEGLLHNFSNELTDLMAQKPDQVKPFLKNRAVIYCHASVDEIVQRIEKRTQETGRTIAHHRGKNTKELYEIVEKDLHEKEAFIQLLSLSGVPILKVSTQHQIKDNVKEITDFIKKKHPTSNNNHDS